MREREMGTLTISQRTFADELVKTFCVTSTQSVPLRVDVKLDEFDEDERVENWPLAINIDASRHLKCFSSCCEVLYSAESHPLGGSPWHPRVH